MPTVNQVCFVQTGSPVYPQRVVQERPRYGINKDKGRVHIQKVLFWLLDRIGAKVPGKFYDAGPDWTQQPNYSRITFDTDTLIQNIWRQRAEVEGRYNLSNSVLLCGTQEFGELVNTVVPGQARFEVDMSMHVHGLKVSVVPWMKGVLVVPKSCL